MNGNLTLGRLGGVEIRINWSWLLIAFALLLVVGGAPFVGAFLLLVSLLALLLWSLWKAGASLLALTGENVCRRAETSELLGRGGPDDPDWMLVPRQRS